MRTLAVLFFAAFACFASEGIDSTSEVSWTQFKPLTMDSSCPITSERIEVIGYGTAIYYNAKDSVIFEYDLEKFKFKSGNKSPEECFGIILRFLLKYSAYKSQNWR